MINFFCRNHGFILTKITKTLYNEVLRCIIAYFLDDDLNFN
ncbi:hypothetical protein EJK55_0131 [Moraxella catarrhalis]|uniref:Uncharacterized protein n=1 Tax=Moraxella catarrhalis TaxID=480 RepID=A0A3Q9GC28_MORCA|nr:hypothetical protein MCR_0428 [Moraxella catarrhalis BBH18]AZQ92466.1 hypothetical protein EJK53_0453 [Moraxella catarrhalis]AZQ94690.1 hypothetical protein EJK48_0456 [Moraxella catarrhalis]RUO13310.1 hypothetical protein EJK54_0072 [Moraxella catarrhalis]RUO15077.1 hypothetical protein EJK55_0131 [Moraxella catarrhalis]